MLAFKKWLEVGGTPWGDAPLQQPIDPEHPERSALFQTKLDNSDRPPCKKKYGQDRFQMKRKMKA
jgi:hypothetical protein